jgi:hypothetical protein
MYIYKYCTLCMMLIKFGPWDFVPKTAVFVMAECCFLNSFLWQFSVWYFYTLLFCLVFCDVTLCSLVLRYEYQHFRRNCHFSLFYLEDADVGTCVPYNIVSQKTDHGTHHLDSVKFQTVYSLNQMPRINVCLFVVDFFYAVLCSKNKGEKWLY